MRESEHIAFQSVEITFLYSQGLDDWIMPFRGLSSRAIVTSRAVRDVSGARRNACFDARRPELTPQCWLPIAQRGVLPDGVVVDVSAPGKNLDPPSLNRRLPYCKSPRF